MDFRSLLQSMTELSESEGSRVHKGTYGTSHGKEDVRDQYGHKVGKIDKEAGTKKDAPKKGRGRPKKGADDSGEVKSYDTKSLGSVFGGGQKPKKEIGKVSKKHSLKEYMEAAEQAIQEGAVAPVEIKPASATQTQVIQQGSKTLGTVNNPQLAAQIKQSIGKGEMTLNPEEEMNEEELDEFIDIDTLNQLASHPMAGTLAAAGGAALGGAIGGAVKKAGDWYSNRKEQQAQRNQQTRMAEGKKPDFLDVDKDEDKEESFKKAVKDKEAKKKVDEGRDHTASQYLDEEVAKVLAREKPGMATTKSNDEFYSAVYHELIEQGLTPKAARYKVSYDEDFISDVASAYNHYQKNPSLDEGAKEDFAMRGIGPTSSFTKPGGPMAVPRGTPTTINRPVQNPTDWKTDPINAASDRAINFISSLGKNNTLEGKDMKDMQVESWESQLKGLLTEGITVSSSQGQQGSPDSVTITATDGDSDQLLNVLRQAGIGVFGGNEQPQIGYGVAQGGEEEFDGTGTEPQASPDVVGDGDDMLSLIKKMSGLSAGPVGGEQGSQDYEDEEGQEAGALEPADGDEEEEGSAEQDSGEEGQDDEEEVTDEGNAFTGKLKQTPQGGKFKMGDKSYKDTSEIEEGGFDREGFGSDGAGSMGAGAGDITKEDDTCNECGMAESKCGCDHEQVEENFANSAKDPAETELMKLKALLSMGNDMHKLKHSQAMGNPVRVAESSTLDAWKKLSGIK